MSWTKTVLDEKNTFVFKPFYYEEKNPFKNKLIKYVNDKNEAMIIIEY